VARTRLYRNGIVELEDFPVDDISDHLRDPDVTIWLDVDSPTHADFAKIAEEFDLHELAVEDAVHEGQRPKLDRYEGHIFITAYEVRVDGARAEPASLAEVAVFVTPRALITVRPRGTFDINAVVDRWDESADLAKSGVAFLLYGLLDFVVDSHFAAVQSLDESVEQLEDLLFADKPRSAQVQRESFDIRKTLVMLRRIVLPMREVVNSLLRRDLHVLDDAMVPYYQDVYDHVLRVTEWTESLRDFVSMILDTNLAIQGNRLNDIMKKVTSWAAIIAVPTAITGFYGQNVPYPGFAHSTGFWTSSAAIIVLSVSLYFFFRSKDWI